MWKKAVILLLLVGVCLAVAAALSRRTNPREWHGLTEQEARDKLAERLGPKADTDKGRAKIDKAIAEMQRWGVLAPDESPAAA